MINALALCHNVTPVFLENGEKDFQASSPDEVALVKFAEQIGLALQERDQNSIVLKGPEDAEEFPEKYQILAIFPFSSESKRMGIVVRHMLSNRIIFYLKGAEVTMEEKVKDKI